MVMSNKPDKVRKKKWTILMQVSAENNLFVDMLSVMEELYSVTGWKDEEYEDINFLVLFDGLSVKRFSEDFARPSLYLVRPDSSFYLEYPVYTLFYEDMTNRSLLKKVYSFVQKTYPAQKYGFIYKGHGSHGEGDIASKKFKERIMKVPVSLMDAGKYEQKKALLENKAKLFKGWSFEDSYQINAYRRMGMKVAYLMVILSKKGDKTLTYRVMAEVLKEVFGETKFEFLFLDCCWGMQIENAYTFKDITKYFIASADLMPAAGVGYTDFLRKIITRPQITGREIATLLLSVFFTNKYDDYEDPDPTFREMGVSLTNLQTDAMPRFLNVFDKFCNHLRSDMLRYAALIKKVRGCCQDHTYSEGAQDFSMFNIDLVWFLENMVHFNRKSLKDPKLESLSLELLYLIVVRLRYAFMGNNYKKLLPGNKAIGGNGITITFPENWAHYYKSMLLEKKGINPAFTTETAWSLFLKDYYINTKNIIQNDKTMDKYMEKIKTEPALAALLNIKPATAGRTKDRIRRFFSTLIEDQK